MALFSQALSTLVAPLRGVHLLWNGPRQFLYAPGGWRIERKMFDINDRVRDLECDRLNRSLLNRLRNDLELHLQFSVVRLTPGTWPGPNAGPCEVFTFDFHQRQSRVGGKFRGRHGLAVGLQNGKVVAFQLLLSALDGRDFDFGSAPVEQVIVYGLKADAIDICLRNTLSWSDAIELVRLQLPLRELSPELNNDNDELELARSRLIADETIDPIRFKQLSDILRTALNGPGKRPIDNLLRLQNNANEPEDMVALDPLRTLLASSKWRRVLGLGYVDQDTDLVPGTRYDYRISGIYPTDQLNAEIFGFHTLSAGVVLPDRFNLNGCHFSLPNPVTVRVAPGIARSGQRWITRLGIKLEKRNTTPWTGLGIDQFSLSIQLPRPVRKLELELEAGHQLHFNTSMLPGGVLTSVTTVPAGSQVQLEFPEPVIALNLEGSGFLFALRLPSLDAAGDSTLQAELRGVAFDETPLPKTPADLRVNNLGNVNQFSTATTFNQIPALHVLGFKVRWRPTAASGAELWPTDMPATQPLDHTAFELQRRIEPDGKFLPVLNGPDNILFGSSDVASPDRAIYPGVDLMALYPEELTPMTGNGLFSYDDTFREPDEANPSRRASPPPSTLLRYRIRTLDAIGRASQQWLESDVVRLEKHEPPPPPAAFDPRPADELEQPGFTGVHARVLVQGSASLRDDDALLLGSSDNVIVLRWGWHGSQRSHDPHATDFRVYVTTSFDVVAGRITSVQNAGGGDFNLQIDVATPIAANHAAGLVLYAGYPYSIIGHSDGTSITMQVRTRIPDSAGQFRSPDIGDISIPLTLAPSMTSPRNWQERFVFDDGKSRMDITAATQYQAVLRDRLLLTADHPRDTLWVGVSSADREAYVADTYPMPGPDGPLVGNESAIVAVRCDARRATRPSFTPPLPVGSSALVLTPEPVGTGVRFELDLLPHVTGLGLSIGELVMIERLDVAEMFGSLGTSDNQILAAPARAQSNNDQPQSIIIDNPDDRSAVVNAITLGRSALLEDRLAVAVAALHPYSDQMFEAATETAVPLGIISEILPASSACYLYRLRRADASASLSVASAILNLIVRVPSTEPGVAPRRSDRQTDDSDNRLRLHLPLDNNLKELVLFRHSTGEPDAPDISLMRLRSRSDLDASQTLRLRIDNGFVLNPESIELSTLPENNSAWQAIIDIDTEQDEDVLLWACSLTNDGIASSVSGPWRVSAPKPSIEAPVLVVSATGDILDFSWSLPDPFITSTWLEISSNNEDWQRASIIRPAPKSGKTLTRRDEQHHYRVVGRSQDGRRVISNQLTV